MKCYSDKFKSLQTNAHKSTISAQTFGGGDLVAFPDVDSSRILGDRTREVNLKDRSQKNHLVKKAARSNVGYANIKF